MGLKLPWSKRKRGTYRTGKQRVSEQQAKVDAHLLKLYLADLKTHPEFARQVAREKFGLSPEPEGEYMGEPPPDILDTIRKANEARELIREEDKGKGTTLTAIAEIVKALPTIAQLLPQIQAQPTQQIAQQQQPRIAQPEPEQIAEPEPKTPQEAMTLFANRFLELQPEEAAAELYANRDEVNDIRHILWSYLSENSVDECLEMIPTVIEMPEYSFLIPFAQKLNTNRGKRWLALVIDEINRLKTQ